MAVPNEQLVKLNSFQMLLTFRPSHLDFQWRIFRHSTSPKKKNRIENSFSYPCNVVPGLGQLENFFLMQSKLGDSRKTWDTNEKEEKKEKRKKVDIIWKKTFTLGYLFPLFGLFYIHSLFSGCFLLRGEKLLFPNFCE